jgi:hypothetical protein
LELLLDSVDGAGRRGLYSYIFVCSTVESSGQGSRHICSYVSGSVERSRSVEVSDHHS